METLDIIFLVLVIIVCVAAFWRDVMGSPSQPQNIPEYVLPEPTAEDLAILNQYREEYEPIPFDNRYATFDADYCELDDIALESTKYLSHHPRPPKANLLALKRGDLVELLFVDEEGEIEQIKVEVLSRDNGIFHGMLVHGIYENRLLVNGKEFWFHPNHIMRIHESK